MKTRESRFHIHDELTAPGGSERLLKSISSAGGSVSKLVGVLAGSPASLREYLDEYVETGANYFVCSFQWGDLTHEQAMRSIELFTAEVMPHYV